MNRSELDDTVREPKKDMTTCRKISSLFVGKIEIFLGILIKIYSLNFFCMMKCIYIIYEEVK